MNECDTGSTMWSAMPASRVEATETLPSLSAPIIAAVAGLIDRFPAITPTSHVGTGGVPASPSVPQLRPAGPWIHPNGASRPTASTISLPRWAAPASPPAPSVRPRADRARRAAAARPSNG